MGLGHRRGPWLGGMGSQAVTQENFFENKGKKIENWKPAVTPEGTQ